MQLVPGLIPRGQPLLGPTSVGSNAQVLASNGLGATYWVDMSSGGVTDHGALTGLADDDHSQYAKLDGRAAGQTFFGSNAASGNLGIYSTSHVTKGTVTINVSMVVGSSGVAISTTPTTPSTPHRLAVRQTQTIPAILLTGQGSSGGTDDAADGISIKLAYNVAGNRQLLIGPAGANNFRIAFVPGNVALLDATDSTGTTRKDMLFGNGSTNVAFGGDAYGPSTVVAFFAGQFGKATAAFRAAATSPGALTEWQASGGSALAAIKSNGAFMPASLADTDAANGTLYYSTTQNKLVFKDAGGAVNALY